MNTIFFLKFILQLLKKSPAGENVKLLPNGATSPKGHDTKREASRLSQSVVQSRQVDTSRTFYIISCCSATADHGVSVS